jgi:hypothetical protein
MTDSTRISDLPENITYSTGEGFPPKQYSAGLTPGLEIPPQMGSQGMPPANGAGYVQMNVHPNPYGHGPPQHGAIGMPQQTHTMKPSNNPFIGMAEGPQHQLPSRDIPQDTLQFSNDPEIVPNYIPPAKVASDFVKEYEQSYEKKEKRIQTRDKTARTLDDLFLELRVPIIVSMLFLLFQSPIFHTYVLKHFSIFAIHLADGNLNVQGLLLKSAMFGATYYVLEKMAEYVR